MNCRHCGCEIVKDDEGRWVDPEATGDDSVWRETCDENHEDRIAAHEPIMPIEWTVVTRAKGGRFFRPVANVPAGLDWRGAVAAAADVVATHPELDVWYVPTQEGQAQGWPEDRDNVLSHTGKRIPIRWDAEPQATYPGRVAVVDIENLKAGDRVPVVAHFETVREAELFLADHEDQAKVERGGFGIDAPEEMS